MSCSCSSEEAREHAVACLSNLALKNPPGRTVILESGALEALLLVLAQDSPAPLKVPVPIARNLLNCFCILTR